jgi:hypothetical protein
MVSFLMTFGGGGASGWGWLLGGCREFFRHMLLGGWFVSVRTDNFNGSVRNREELGVLQKNLSVGLCFPF